jgi:hypothetical protein
MSTQIPINYNINQETVNILGYTLNQSDETEALKVKIAEDFNTNIYHKSVYKNLDKSKTYDIQIYDGKDNKKKFISYPYETIQFSIGNYISYVDKNGVYQILMIVSLDQTNEWEVNGEIEDCNYTFTWQNSSGTILSYPSIKKTTNTVGINEGNVISLPNSIVTIELPFDSETKLLDVDRRFFIDDLSVEIPQVYAISKPDRTSTKGIIKLTMKQDAYNKDIDNKELGICGVKTVVPTPADGQTSSVIVIDGDIIVGGSKRTISCVLYNTDKTINTTVVPVWNVVIPSGYKSYIKAELDLTDNHKYYITAIEDDNYTAVGQVITVNVSDGSNGFVGKLELTVGAM